jgi:hypothetical protein
MSLLLLAHVAATWMMVGLIWFVQIVHYPLFARVGPGQFAQYEASHSRLTTWVVGPPMLVEGATAIALLVLQPYGLPCALLWLGAGLLLVIWGSTALLQVPQHEILLRGFAADAHGSLVTSNWIRTIGWSIRGVLVLLLLKDLLTK